MLYLEKLFRAISRSGIRRRFRNTNNHVSHKKSRLKVGKLPYLLLLFGLTIFYAFQSFLM